jgi:hypothetical protein
MGKHPRDRRPNYPTDKSIARAARKFTGKTVTSAQEFMADEWGGWVSRVSAAGNADAGEIYESLWTDFVAALRADGRVLEDR